MSCFNCGSPLHVSASCPKPPRYTRCPNCHLVADTPVAHKQWCTNKVFKSTYLGVDSCVFDIQPILSINFDDVSEIMTINDTKHDKVIGSGVLWLSTHDTYLRKSENRKLCLYGYRPMQRELVFVDETDKPILAIMVDEHFIKLNHKYTIFDNGSLLTAANVPEIRKPDECYIKIRKTSEIFKVGIQKWNKFHLFVVYPFGTFYVDAQMQIGALNSTPPPNLGAASIDAEDEASTAGSIPLPVSNVLGAASIDAEAEANTTGSIPLPVSNVLGAASIDAEAEANTTGSIPLPVSNDLGAASIDAEAETNTTDSMSPPNSNDLGATSIDAEAETNTTDSILPPN